MRADLERRNVAQRALTSWWTYRAPLSVALVVAAALMMSDQFEEIFLVNAELALDSGGVAGWIAPRALTTIYLPVLSIFFLVLYLRVLIFALHRRLPDLASPPGKLTLLLCCAPQIALIAELGQLLTNPAIPSQLDPHLWTLMALSVLLLAGAVLLGTGTNGWGAGVLDPLWDWLDDKTHRLFGAVSGDLGRLVAIAGATTVVIGALVWFVPAIGLVAMLVLLLYANLRKERVATFQAAGGLFALVVFFVLDPVSWGIGIGPLPVICVFAAMLAGIASAASVLEDRHQVPVTLMLVGALIGFSWFDLNDNHFIKMTETPLPAHAQAFDTRPMRSEVEAAFLAWLDCRADHVPGQPYTVYLVAAQGGGLYAAYQSANFLARVQDREPRFAGRIFAMSGVSGGAVGVTVFGSLVRDFPAEAGARPQPCADGGPVAQPRDAGFYSDAVGAVLKQDYLSPVGTAMLFGDFLARFSPVPIPAADRARALQAAFERNWNAAFGSTGGKGLGASILEHWRPGGDAPLLLLNVTDVDTGQRVIASTPFREIAPGKVTTFRAVTGCGAGAAVCAAPSLAASMLLSARFPVVTPAGSIALPQCRDGTTRAYCWREGDPRSQRKARFVDGGYFENSGLDTVADLIEALKTVQAERKILFTVLSFDFPPPPIPARATGLGEVASPVRALLNTRSARTVPARQRVAALPDTLLQPVSLDDRERKFTLGWLLSDNTFRRIERDLRDEDLCADPRRWQDPAEEEAIRVANCRTVNYIRDELRLILPQAY